jgi:hypothetical protein
MLKNIMAMARAEETKVDASRANGVSTAIQI